MNGKRASGVLMHISSLPSEYGIGTLGQAAYSFVDWLKSAKQEYWQILPVCPTSCGDSPYQSFSTFAGNPYFIDLIMLCNEGLLEKSECDSINWGDDETAADYGLLYLRRNELFQKMQPRFMSSKPSGYDRFCEENAFWLDDYSLFMAVKDEHGGAAYQQWEDGIRRHEKAAVEEYAAKCSQRVQYYKMLQYLFFRQWAKLKKYANDNGVKIIGDAPIYVSGDSADVWSNPKQFALSDDLRPIEVAGCPPDAFSKDGQLWGNPVYNWKYMKRTKYRWWITRLRESLKIYDVIRIDHFRGFESYYCIPYGAKTAKKGVWRKGPGMKLWKSAKRQLGDMPIIAEDLGIITPQVRNLLKDSGFPGMKVLQFAFSTDEESGYLPHNYERSCVVYTGTHDNDTIIGWAENGDESQVEYAKEYLRAQSNEQLCENMMLSALQSPADLCILTMQDIIGLDSHARMNTPSTVGNNWRWRAKSEQITRQKAEWLAKYTEIYCRTARTKLDEKGEKNEQSQK